ncbi:hypothetical protein ACIRN4_09000 [Pimelobacter simplex]|uniref:hypothetical protein n=1 Tax=Nocardioides simplex TaxID=2045 RepID=UPI00380014A3
MDHTTRLAATIALLAALLGGCGTDDEPAPPSFAGKAPADQVAAARTAMADLHAVHLTGTLTNAGRPLDLDLALADDGSCAGTLGVDGGVAEVRATEDGAWFRPNATLWSSIVDADPDADTDADAAGEQIAEAVGERWVVLEDDDLRALCDFRSIMSSLISAPEDGRVYTSAGTEEVDGAPTLRIRSDDGNQGRGAGGGGTTYGYIRTDAPHYLVRTERPGGEAPATMTFSDFDVVPDVVTPAADDVVAPDELDALAG